MGKRETILDRRIVPVDVKKFSGYESRWWRRSIPPLRRGHYWVTDRTVTGAAPKDFIRVYEYGQGRRDKPLTWPAHIAKVGHKWYPVESITEQLMTRVGQIVGVRMAESMLMSASDQIRFLSRYFLEEDESLVHGAEVITGYVEDPDFVDHVESEHLEREIFTFQVLKAAILTRFPSHGMPILHDFIRMIGFDALVGNNDRHLYNWGVIVDPRGVKAPVFSPIYDTARGLLWNESETRLARFGSDDELVAYARNARPLIGWDRGGEIDHFRLIGNIVG